MTRFPPPGGFSRAETSGDSGSRLARLPVISDCPAHRRAIRRLPLLAFVFCLALAAAIVPASARTTAALSKQSDPANASLIQVPTSTGTLSAALSPTPLQLTATPSQTPGRQGKPTRTPRPTGTPVPVPPPSDPGTTRVMAGFGVLIVLVIGFGIWLNRKTAF